MNTRKTVYEKLFRNDETKLATHEVDLALVDDLAKLVLSNKNAISEANRYIDNVKLTWPKLNAVVDEIDNMRSYVKSIPSAKNALAFNNQEINKIISQIVAQTKSLGVDVKGIKSYNEAINSIEKNNDFIKQLDFQKTVAEKILLEFK
jgi:hypothetical protein